MDLNPAAYSTSYAFAVNGDTQGGSGETVSDGQTHELLWHGSAASVVDLNPNGFESSNVMDISGNMQVGFENVNGNVGGGPTDHALLWNGTANSYVDLQQYLPNSGVNFTGSQAFSIAANGEIVGNAYAAGAYYAVNWTPVPEPGGALLCITVAIAISAFRRRPKSQSKKRTRTRADDSDVAGTEVGDRAELI